MQFNIHKTHPNFYFVILGLALTVGSIGGLMFLIPEHSKAFYPFVTPFFIISALLLTGLFSGRYSIVRLGLILGTAYLSFLGYAFIFSIGIKLDNTKVRELAWLVPPWILMSFVFLLSLKEPPINPASQK